MNPLYNSQNANLGAPPEPTMDHEAPPSSGPTREMFPPGPDGDQEYEQALEEWKAGYSGSAAAAGAGAGEALPPGRPSVRPERDFFTE